MSIDMDFPQKLMTRLSSIITFVTRFFPELYQPRLEQEQPPATSSIDVEMPQSQTMASPFSPSLSNDQESSESQFPSQASEEASIPATSPNLKQQLEPILAAQQHLQWQNAVLAFCFSYADNISDFLQSVGTDQCNHDQLPLPLVLLSFLVLFTFTFILVAFFVYPICRRTSQTLEKVAFLLAASAFCHALSIPLSFEFQCAVWAVFLLTLVIIMSFRYSNPNTAWS